MLSTATASKSRVVEPRRLVLSIIVLMLAARAEAAPISHNIKLDHFGYRPDDAKIAVFSADPGATVEVRDLNDVVVMTIPTDGGSITAMGNDGSPSGDTVWWVDFSHLGTPGSYRLYSQAIGGQ